MTVEVVATRTEAMVPMHLTPKDSARVYVNGQLRKDFPIELPDGTMLYNEHRPGFYSAGHYANAETYKPIDSANYRHVPNEGVCIDAGSGLFSIDVMAVAMLSGDPGWNKQFTDPPYGKNSVGAYSHAAPGTTTVDSDSVCNYAINTTNKYRMYDWDVPLVSPEQSLFTRDCSELSGVCQVERVREFHETPRNVLASYKTDAPLQLPSYCKDNGLPPNCPVEKKKLTPAVMKWFREIGTFYDAIQQCEALPPVRPAQTVEQVCKQAGISLDAAKARCSGKPESCQFDYCASGGAEPAASGGSPKPACLIAKDCKPKALCCQTVEKGIVNFSNPVTNTLIGGGELRYAQAFKTDGGQLLDLRITAVNDFKPRGDVSGFENGFGVIPMKAGTTTDFDFTFVKTGTDEPASDAADVALSFYDIDQGKKTETASDCQGLWSKGCDPLGKHRASGHKQ